MNSPSSKYLYGRTSTFGTRLTTTEAEGDAIMAALNPGPDDLYPSKSMQRRVQAQKRIPVLMPHEQRQALIRAPFVATVHLHSSAWGGVFIRESVPTEGRRVWQERPEDEEWMKNRWEEK